MTPIREISYSLLKDSFLLAEYAAECSIPEFGPTNPQWETYEALEKLGALRVFGAYLDKTLVGFGSLLMHVLPHYGVKAAVVESLFVPPAMRIYGAGSALMQTLEKTARISGCRAILYSAPSGGSLEDLLEKRYTRTNAVFVRAL